MKFKWIAHVRRQRRTAVLLIAIALLVIVPAAYATLYTISTTDNSVSDWNTVPVFQTDGLNDCGSCTDAQDIVSAKVASEDTDADSLGDFVNFLVETDSAGAIGGDKGVVASIDCDNDGLHEEFDDRLVVYNPNSDAILVLHGNQFGQAAILGQDLGQKVGEFYEWGVPLSELFPFPDDTPGLPPDYCRGTVGIFLATATVVGFPATAIDETDREPYAMIDLPTAVSVHSFAANNVSGNASTIFLALTGLIVFGTVTGFTILRRRNKQ